MKGAVEDVQWVFADEFPVYVREASTYPVRSTKSPKRSPSFRARA